MFESASELEKYGLKTFALARNSKVPSKGYKWMQMVGEPLAARFSGLVGYNLAIATGEASGVIAVDLDHGATEHDLAMFPRTWRVKSRDGYHLYFKYTPRMKKGIQPLFGGTTNAATAHVRGNGHYFVAPPSVVSWCEKTNRALDPWEYRWDADAGGELRPGECELAECPPWMLRCFDFEKPFEECPDDEPDVTPGGGARTVVPGERHHDLLTYGRWLWDHTTDEKLVEEKLRARNESYQEPKPRDVFEKELSNMMAWFRTRIGAMGRLANVKQQAPAAQPTAVVASVEETWRNWKRTAHGHTIEALGYSGSDRYYFTTSVTRDIIATSESKLRSGGLFRLGPKDVLMAMFGTRGKNESLTVNYEEAANQLVTKCLERGVYDPSNARGVGVFREGDKFIYNSGRALWINGEKVPFDHVDTQNFYTSGKDCGDLRSDAPLTSGEGQKLYEAVQLANWARPIFAKQYVGALAVARIFGALDWRPSVFNTGARGSGKTTLIKLADQLLGRMKEPVDQGTTAAGIRNLLGNNSKPLTYEEAEGGDQRATNIISDVVRLIRSATSDDGRAVVKGTADNGVKIARISTMFFMNAIRVTLPEESDESRWLVLRLNPIPKTPEWIERKQQVDEAYEQFDQDFGDRLFARMYLRLPELRKTIKRFQRKIALQSDNRTGDTQSVFLAAWWAATHDEAPTDQQIDELVAELDIKGQAEREEIVRDDVAALEYITCLPVKVEMNDATHHLTIGTAVEMARAEGRPKGEGDHHWWSSHSGFSALTFQLSQMGIVVEADQVHIQSRHPRLEELMSNSRWGKQFVQSLRANPAWGWGRSRKARKRAYWVSIPYTLSEGVFEP